MPPAPAGTFANFGFQAPADTDIVRVTLWRYGTGTLGTDDSNTPLNESGRFEVNAMFGGNSIFADTCHPGSGVWPNPCHTGSPGYSEASKVVHDGRADTFTVGVFCGGDNGPFIACSTDDNAGNPYGYVDFQGATVRLEDNTAPRAAASGALLSAGWRRPSDGVAISASDNSGIRAARVDVDGRTLTRRGLACDSTRPVPCPSLNGARFTGSGIGDGGHTVRLVAEDAAGNTGVVQRTVQVDGTPPSVVLEHARGKEIVFTVTDSSSGIASTGIEVRNGSNQPYRTLKSNFTNGKLRATIDTGSA